jgi:hypothetical protein
VLLVEDGEMVDVEEMLLEARELVADEELTVDANVSALLGRVCSGLEKSSDSLTFER